MTIIRDGTGDTYAALVDKDHHLHVAARTRSLLHSKARSGDAFFISSPIISVGTGTTDPIYFFQYDNPSKLFVLEETWVNWDGGASYNATLRVDFRAVISPPTGNNTVILGRNTNLQSSKTIDTTSYYWDGVGNGMTGSTSIQSGGYIVPPGFTKIDHRGAFIFGAGDRHMIQVQAPVSGVFSYTLLGYEMLLDEAA